MDSAYYMTVNLNEDKAKAEQEANDFILKYYGINFWKDKWGPFGSPQRVVERMEQFAQAGVRNLILRFASFEQQQQLNLFLEQVLPAFRSLH
jgi:alkanesulfonate monooxygenase SsuD/methylene tetrahydromethanopterin reductase-like flavin-dependent oxidoreductase (luciferase family)